MSVSALSCDVLVVGAGPAGATAALAAVRTGVRVLMVECRKTVGVPVQCAEYVPAMLVGRLQLGKGFIVQAIRSMRTYLPGHPVKETAAPGFTICRATFDQTLVRAATEAGADLMLSTRAIRRIDCNHVMLKRNDGEEVVVRAHVIMGADGPRSTVGRWVGAVNRRLLAGLQVTLPLTHPLEHTEVYFEPDILAGYGWLFPKQGVANVGLALNAASQAKGSPRRVLDRFVARLVAERKVSTQPVGWASGWIPVEPVRKAVHGNVALVGDAAGHTHPITGAGIFAAVTCGEMAGKWAARAILEKDRNLLENYDYEWMDLFGDTLVRAHQRRLEMEAEWEDFPHIIRKCWVAFRSYYSDCQKQ